jgi:fatty acid desaturase
MSADSLTPKDARDACRDLFAPRAAIYWADLIGSAALGWTSFALAVAASPWSLAHAGWSVLAAVALYRAVLFTHELTHAAKGTLPGFAAAWDALIGVPLMLPSFMYQEVHTLHHRRTVYGTAGDPEYLPFATGPRRAIVRYATEPLLLPFLLVLRFAILAPLSALIGGAPRRLVVSAASSLAINYAFRREPPSPWLRRRWIVTEAAASVFAWTVAVLIVADVLPLAVATQWYLTAAAIGSVNALRTLGAHRYRLGGAETDVTGQLVDSVNTPGSWWTELWAPVGLRYHGLHHFLPDLPYHALGTAHRRLAAALPVASPYFRATSSGLWSSLAALWRDAGRGASVEDSAAGVAASAKTGAA